MPRKIQIAARRGTWLQILDWRPSFRWRFPVLRRLVRTGSTTDGEKPSNEKKETPIIRKFLENGATSLATLLMLGFAGYSYNQYYKQLVLQKIENAFARGYSTGELASLGQNILCRDASQHFRVTRPEQPVIDAIVDGRAVGQYHLLFGEKGTGKTSMLLEAVRKVDGNHVAMLEAHGDLEVFRLRLGEAIDYEYHEDYIGGLFSIKGPRVTTPLLDIERALNKLEEVAIKHRSTHDKPLILVINNIHHIQEHMDAQNLLTLLQQRAELWSGSGLVTVIFTSEEYRTTDKLRSHATRMQVLNVQDISKDLAVRSLREYRWRRFREKVPTEVLDEVYRKVGGRLFFLDQVARSEDMLETCDAICEREKQWLLSQCWILGTGMDGGAVEQQRFSAAAMLLAKTLVDMERDAIKDDDPDGCRLPEIPLHKANELMGRADYIQELDRINIITIDSNAAVKADSIPMQNAFRAVCGAVGFADRLKATHERLKSLASLRRARESTLRDLWESGRYEVVAKGESAADLPMQNVPQ
ncbi:hypothetical protein VTN02DRAFT_4490 [Thermoascus thermophilus]